jgi:glucans biosynthesis protein C
MQKIANIVKLAQTEGYCARMMSGMSSDNPLHRNKAATTSLTDAWATLWDARGLLAILGIILHTARIYAPQRFALSDPELHIYFRHLVDFIHAFRMEAFFVLSGAALYVVIGKRQTGILRNRTIRLLIPFLFTAVLLNLPILQLTYFLSPGLKTETELDLFSSRFWLSGNWVLHLWFIRSLMLYTLGYCLLCKSPRINRFASTLIATTPRALYLPGLALLLLAPSVLSYMSPSFAKPVLGDGNTLLGSFREHFHYGLYFGFGILIARYRHLVQEIVQFRKELLIGALVVCLCCLLLTRGSVTETDLASTLHSVVLAKIILELIRQTSVLALIYLSVQIVAVLRRTPVKAPMQRWAKASYTIYLVHQPVIWLLAIGFQGLALPIWIKFAAITFITYSICMGFNSLLVLGKIGWTRFMFTGKLAAS